VGRRSASIEAFRESKGISAIQGMRWITGGTLPLFPDPAAKPILAAPSCLPLDDAYEVILNGTRLKRRRACPAPSGLGTSIVPRTFGLGQPPSGVLPFVFEGAIRFVLIPGRRGDQAYAHWRGAPGDPTYRRPRP